MREFRKRLLPLLPCVALAAFGAFAADPLELGVWTQDFESRLPGEIPQGWRVAWGSVPLCDSLATSNMESLSGRRSLLLERFSQDGPVTQYGFSCSTAPLPKKGEALLCIPFKGVGSGNELSFSVEIRDASGQGRLISLYFNNGDVKAKGKGDKRAGELGPLRSGQWQRVLLSIPSGEDGKDATALLETRRPDGSWLQERPADEVAPLKRVEGGRPLCVMICAGIGKGPYKVYFDALRLEPLNSSP